MLPAITAIAEVKTNAPAEAKKTANGESFESVAKRSVAICVLSPSSAKSTEKKIVKNDNILIILQCGF